MCTSTRFPATIHLRKISSQVIIKALTKLLTQFGMPKEIQSDQGSNFTSGIFPQIMHQLGMKHIMVSAYHPQSQKDSDEGIHLLLFASREVVQESFGFSTFELVFGHTVRGPLKVVEETRLQDTRQYNVSDYMCEFKYRLYKACDFPHKNLKETQERMKRCYDKKPKDRVFSVGDRMLVLLPIPGGPLRAKFVVHIQLTRKSVM